jgi:hypothetical protein
MSAIATMRRSAAVDGPARSAAAPATAEATAAPPRPKKVRWLALDLLRFVAVVLMVQGHTFSTLLNAETKAQAWYPHHSFVHGYTAPMFMFSAGLAFGYTTFRRWHEHASVGPQLFRRLKRYFWLFVLGYGLHLPVLSLARLLDRMALWELKSPRRLEIIWQVDVLQHIGMALVICQLLVLVLKRKELFVAVLGVLSLLAIFFAPYVWQPDLGELGVPLPLAGYVNASTGSIFPLVPWVGFTYLGVLVAYGVGLSDRGGAHSVSEKVAWPLAVLAILFLAGPVFVDRLGWNPYPPHNFWKTNPLFFFFRLGNVVAVLAVLCFLEVWMRRRGFFHLGDDPHVGARVVHAVLPWVLLIGAESLVIYVAHLLVLHGSVFAPGIKHVIGGHAHGVATASLVALLLMAAMVALAKAWTLLKRNAQGFQAFQVLVVSLFLYVFLFT